MEGYAKIAWRMTTNPDLAIFRGFRALNAQNLLYLQAELVHLEFRLREQADADAQSEDEQRRLYSRDWYTLKRAKDGDGVQWSIISEARTRLKEYNDALAQQAFLSRLPKPRPNHLNILKSSLEDPKLPDYLLGRDSTVWTDPNTIPDLISVYPVHDFDHVSLWLIKRFLGLYHRIIGRRYKCESDGDGGIFYYDDQHLQVPASIFSTVLASLMPVVSVVVLYLVRSMPKRLGIIAAFTAVFSLILALFTKARRVDIFAATAAFAAVQVVFIGTNANSSD